MNLHLDGVVPWGRSYDEYTLMFALAEGEHERTIVGCGDGPASFNAALHRRGRRVVSVDPLYSFTREQIAGRIEETRVAVMSEVERMQGECVWDRLGSPAGREQARMAAMTEVLDDCETGKREGRYVDAALPQLPFDDGQFELALCSHLLFLYSDQLSEEFHRESVRELCRVASEVRIFPVTDLRAQRSKHLDTVLADLDAEGANFGG